MRPFPTLHKRWLLSFTSLPTGRDEGEGAGCGIPFFRSLLGVIMALGCAAYSTAQASTYVVYLPLDSPVYDELDTLNGLGLLRSYISEIRPISRIEAARLTL
jgi:hypothetical protein